MSEPAVNNGEVSRPGISDEFLRRHEIRHVDGGEAERLVGYKAPGIIIPYFGLTTRELMVNSKRFCRLRLDHPTCGAKYLSPRAAGVRLYVPQGPPFGPELVIVEGEFKAISLSEAGIRAVGIGGISCAMPEGELLPDLRKLLYRHHPHIVFFVGDSDTALNIAFSHEAVKIAGALPGDCVLRVGTLSGRFYALMAEAGLVEPRKHVRTGCDQSPGRGRDGRRRLVEISFHALRHTATSLMKNAGISPAIVQDVIGHESEAVSANYTHIEESANRRAVEAIPDVLA
jgi:hypothetical protein